MDQASASALLLLWRVPDAAAAALLAVLPALGLRSVGRILLDQGRPWLLTLLRLATGGGAMAAAGALVPLAALRIEASPSVVVAAVVAFVLTLASVILPGQRGLALAALGPLLILLGLGMSLVALLLPTGLLPVEPEQATVALVLTGEARREVVRWAPAGLPLREEGLRAHRIFFQRPDGTLVGEAWLFGTAAVVGAEAFGPVYGATSLLRLTSLRNLAPLEAGRSRLFPPKEVEIEPRGPAVVPPWWRRRQDAFLRWLGLGPRELASDPLPLLDAQALPLRTVYPLTVGEDGRLTRSP